MNKSIKRYNTVVNSQRHVHDIFHPPFHIKIYKYLHTKWDIDCNDLFTISPQNRVTRLQQSYMSLVVPFSRLDLRKNFFTVRGSTIWNSLPDEVRHSDSVNNFKNKYDSYMITAD